MSLRYCWNQYDVVVTERTTRVQGIQVPNPVTYAVSESYRKYSNYYALTGDVHFDRNVYTHPSSPVLTFENKGFDYLILNGNTGRAMYHAVHSYGGYHWVIYNGEIFSADDDDYRVRDPLEVFEFADTRGTTLIGQIVGSSNSQYPQNGVSGSYWYVYQGSDSIDPVAVNLSQSSGLYVGLPITISVDPSTSKVYSGTVSYQYQVQINNDGQWITLGTTTETSYPYTIPTGATNLQFRVLASDDLGFTSTDYVNSASVSVVAFKPGTQQVLHRKNASGGYDVIWLETDSEVVIRPDGTTLDATLVDIESRLSGLGV